MPLNTPADVIDAVQAALTRLSAEAMTHMGKAYREVCRRERRPPTPPDLNELLPPADVREVVRRISDAGLEAEHFRLEQELRQRIAAEPGAGRVRCITALFGIWCGTVFYELPAEQACAVSAWFAKSFAYFAALRELGSRAGVDGVKVAALAAVFALGEVRSD